MVGQIRRVGSANAPALHALPRKRINACLYERLIAHYAPAASLVKATRLIPIPFSKQRIARSMIAQSQRIRVSGERKPRQSRALNLRLRLRRSLAPSARVSSRDAPRMRSLLPRTLTVGIPCHAFAPLQRAYPRTVIFSGHTRNFSLTPLRICLRAHLSLPLPLRRAFMHFSLTGDKSHFLPGTPRYASFHRVSVVKSDSGPRRDEQKPRRIDRSAVSRYLSRPRFSLSLFSLCRSVFYRHHRNVSIVLGITARTCGWMDRRVQRRQFASPRIVLRLAVDIVAIAVIKW